MTQFDPQGREAHSRGLVVKCTRAIRMLVLVTLGQAHRQGKRFPRIGRELEFGGA